MLNRYFTDYQRPSDMYKKLRKIEGEKNEDQVYLIKETLNKLKKKKKLKIFLKMIHLRLKKTKR